MIMWQKVKINETKIIYITKVIKNIQWLQLQYNKIEENIRENKLIALF